MPTVIMKQLAAMLPLATEEDDNSQMKERQRRVESLLMSTAFNTTNDVFFACMVPQRCYETCFSFFVNPPAPNRKPREMAMGLA